MPLLADPADLRAIAERLSRHADVVLAVGDRLRAAPGLEGWSGVAADAFRHRFGGVFGSLGYSAARIDDAADALRRLAGAWDDVLDTLRRLGSDAVRLTIDAGELTVDLLRHPDAIPATAEHLAADVGGFVSNVGSGVLDALGF